MIAQKAPIGKGSPAAHQREVEQLEQELKIALGRPLRTRSEAEVRRLVQRLEDLEGPQVGEPRPVPVEVAANV